MGKTSKVKIVDDDEEQPELTAGLAGKSHHSIASHQSKASVKSDYSKPFLSPLRRITGSASVRSTDAVAAPGPEKQILMEIYLFY